MMARQAGASELVAIILIGSERVVLTCRYFGVRVCNAKLTEPCTALRSCICGHSPFIRPSGSPRPVCSSPFRSSRDGKAVRQSPFTSMQCVLA